MTHSSGAAPAAATKADPLGGLFGDDEAEAAPAAAKKAAAPAEATTADPLGVVARAVVRVVLVARVGCGVVGVREAS